ncbi:MAG: hypothetical protein IT563_09525 [Alphaproteobacteria bacterium]|nr:hypothetical protein [Alphaproteobacteria bacterium]
MIGGASVQFAPLMPWVGIAALGVALLLVIAVAFWRRAGGAAWRLAIGALLLLALANPSLVNEQRENLPDVAVLLVDESASNRIADRAEQREETARRIKERLKDERDLELREVRAGAADASLAGGEEGTRLFQALDRALAEIPRKQLAGIIMLTDGQVHDAPQRDKDGNFQGEALPAPLHALLTGHPGEADRRLRVVQAPSFGMVGKRQTMTVRVEDETAPAGTRARLTIRENGGEQKVESVPVGVDHQVELKIEHGGLIVYELEVDAGQRELSLVNNRAVVSVNGVRDRLRVLLVSGEPHAGERTWRSLLKADPSVDLVHFTILRPPEKQDGTPIRELSLIAFPIRELFELRLDDFDLIIFDRYRRRGVLPNAYLQNIAAFVEKGGAFLEAVGPTYGTPLGLYRSPLGAVLPGEPTGQLFEQGFRPKLTDIGKRHPVTAELPGAEATIPAWGRWFRQVEVEATRGKALMGGVNDQPLLLLDRVGKGRVAQVLSDHMWLWARGYEGGGPSSELLRRTAHWLMKEPELEENVLKASVQGGRLSVTRRVLERDDKSVTVTTPSGEEKNLELVEDLAGRANGALAVTEPGLYRVSDGQRTAIAAAGSLNPLEYADLRATPDKLNPAIEASKGTYRWLASAAGASIAVPDIRRVLPGRSTAGRDWIGLTRNGEYRVTGVQQIPLLPVVLVLALALAGLALAWWREAK